MPRAVRQQLQPKAITPRQVEARTAAVGGEVRVAGKARVEEDVVPHVVAQAGAGGGGGDAA